MVVLIDNEEFESYVTCFDDIFSFRKFLAEDVRSCFNRGIKSPYTKKDGSFNNEKFTLIEGKKLEVKDLRIETLVDVRFVIEEK